MNDVHLSTAGLDQLLKALKRPGSVKVGILGDKTTRGSGAAGKAPNNATIGAWHEFGTAKLPVRSFLRVPIMDHLDKRIEGAGLLGKEALAQVLKTGTFTEVLKKLGIIAEGIVAEAFASGGFGKWKALKPETLARKKNHQILVETQQLRNSISSEVKLGS